MRAADNVTNFERGLQVSRRIVLALAVVIGVLGAAAASQALASENLVPAVPEETLGESDAHWAEMVSMMESHGVDVSVMMSMMTSDMGGMSQMGGTHGMGSMGGMGTGMDGMGAPQHHVGHHGSFDG